MKPQAQEAVVEYLLFYSRYHSSRYVGDCLVFRLNEPLPARTLAQINGEFSDILLHGSFEQRLSPLEEERGAHPGKPRLVFAFDRRSAGRLRLLIDRINADE